MASRKSPHDMPPKKVKTLPKASAGTRSVILELHKPVATTKPSRSR